MMSYTKHTHILTLDAIKVNSSECLGLALVSGHVLVERIARHVARAAALMQIIATAVFGASVR